MQKGPVGLLLIMFPKLLAFPALVNSLLELFFFLFFSFFVVIACPSWASFHYSLLFILVIHSSLSQCFSSACYDFPHSISVSFFPYYPPPNTLISPAFLASVITVTSFLWHPVQFSHSVVSNSL